MKYYFGGYYLMKLKPINFGTDVGKIVYSCSECINDSLVDTWAYYLDNHNNKEEKKAIDNFLLTGDRLTSIKTWVDAKHKANKLGWVNVFSNLETVKEYRQTFFSHLDDIKILALYFDENAAKDILQEFKSESEKIEEIGLCLTLSKEIEEIDTDTEILLGFDLLGIEVGGSFHTFHCHDIGAELSNKFGLRINENLLFDETSNWKSVLDYMNDEENGCEPVPWFVAKTKLVTV